MTDQQHDHTTHDEYDPSIQAEGIMATDETYRQSDDDDTYRGKWAPLLFFLVSAVSGALTAMVLVYGTIEPEVTLNTVLMGPLVVLAMILTVPAWAMVYLAILKAVEDTLRTVYTGIFDR